MLTPRIPAAGTLGAFMAPRDLSARCRAGSLASRSEPSAQTEKIIGVIRSASSQARASGPFRLSVL